MAPLTATSAQAAYDELEKSLTVTESRLVELTQEFLDEFRLGLGQYGKPLAMMCVRNPDVCNTNTRLARPSSRVYPMARKLGVCLDLYAAAC